jgi:hypothetical protein
MDVYEEFVDLLQNRLRFASQATVELNHESKPHFRILARFGLFQLEIGGDEKEDLHIIQHSGWSPAFDSNQEQLHLMALFAKSLDINPIFVPENIRPWSTFETIKEDPTLKTQSWEGIRGLDVERGYRYRLMLNNSMTKRHKVISFKKNTYRLMSDRTSSWSYYTDLEDFYNLKKGTPKKISRWIFDL